MPLCLHAMPKEARLANELFAVLNLDEHPEQSY